MWTKIFSLISLILVFIIKQIWFKEMLYNETILDL